MTKIADSLVYAEFSGDVHFFCFWLGIPFMGKLDQKSQNCQFKVKFGN